MVVVKVGGRVKALGGPRTYASERTAQTSSARRGRPRTSTSPYPSHGRRVRWLGWRLARA
eukprot:361570-Chlamydomonas_euryale.AAC.1